MSKIEGTGIGYIYKTTNLINNKIYIGQHLSNRLDSWYLGSGKLLLKAIDKYGRAAFKMEILQWCDTEDELNTQEQFWIKEFNSTDNSIGYNLSAGGYVPRLIGEHNGMYGRTHTPEVKEKLSNLAKQNKHPFGRGLDPSYEEKRRLGCKRYNSNRPKSHNENISKGLTGRKMSEEQRQKTREISKRQWVPGKMTAAAIKARRERESQGIPWVSQEQRAKIRDTLTGSKWMYKDSHCLLVHRWEIDQYLSNGYNFGKLRKRGDSYE